MPSSVFSLEGVLAQSSSVAAAPIDQGIRVFHALRTGYRPTVIITALGLGEANHWLRVQGISTDHYDLLISRLPWETQEREQVRRVMGAGHNIGLFVTADLEEAREVMNMGICVATLLHPVYLRPEFRPDHLEGVKPWAEIEEETERQKVMLAEDARVQQ